MQRRSLPFFSSTSQRHCHFSKRVCLTPPRATAPPNQGRAGLGGVGGHAPISLLSTWWQYWVNTQSQPDRAPALRTGKYLVSSWERMVMVFSSKATLLKPCRVWSAHPTFAAPGGQWQHCGVLGDVLFWDYEHASWIDLVGTTEQAAWIPSSFHMPAIQWKGLVVSFKEGLGGYFPVRERLPSIAKTRHISQTCGENRRNSCMSDLPVPYASRESQPQNLIERLVKAQIAGSSPQSSWLSRLRLGSAYLHFIKFSRDAEAAVPGIWCFKHSRLVLSSPLV